MAARYLGRVPSRSGVRLACPTAAWSRSSTATVSRSLGLKRRRVIRLPRCECDRQSLIGLAGPAHRRTHLVSESRHDSHQDSIQVCVVNNEGRVLENRSIDNESNLVERLRTRHGVPQRIAIEASCGSAESAARACTVALPWQSVDVLNSASRPAARGHLLLKFGPQPSVHSDAAACGG